MWFYFQGNRAEVHKEPNPVVLVIKQRGTAGVPEGGRDAPCIQPTSAGRATYGQWMQNPLAMHPSIDTAPIAYICITKLSPSRESPELPVQCSAQAGNLRCRGLSHLGISASPCANHSCIWDETDLRWGSCFTDPAHFSYAKNLYVALERTGWILPRWQENNIADNCHWKPC